MTLNKRERNMDVLRPKALEQIYAHASRSYPEECCGFVFADGSVHLGSNIQNELHRKNPEIYPRTAANGLGLDNAATPIGLKAMKALQELNPIPNTASNAQILFLVLNASSLTLLPVTIFMYRAQQGAADPTLVFLPILLAFQCLRPCAK